MHNLQEYAGLGGNVEFSKQEFELQFNRSLFCNAVSFYFFILPAYLNSLEAAIAL